MWWAPTTAVEEYEDAVLGAYAQTIPPADRAGLHDRTVILPFAIETIQLLATGLGRACQSSDVADNLTGLAIGLVIGVVARRLSGGLGQPRPFAR